MSIQPGQKQITLTSPVEQKNKMGPIIEMLLNATRISGESKGTAAINKFMSVAIHGIMMLVTLSLLTFLGSLIIALLGGPVVYFASLGYPSVAEIAICHAMMRIAGVEWLLILFIVIIASYIVAVQASKELIATCGGVTVAWCITSMVVMGILDATVGTNFFP